jgi:hypothetical protein
LRKPHPFPLNRSSKNAGTIHFMFEGRFGVSQMGSKDGLHNNLADFLHKIKVSQQIGREDAIISKMGRLERSLYEAAKNFNSLKKIKIKI